MLPQILSADDHTPEMAPLDEYKAVIEKPTMTSINLNTFFLGGLFLLALLTSFYVARAIVMPVVLAFVMKLVLQPFLRTLQKYCIPPTIASLIILLVVGGVIFGFGTALSGPAMNWAEKLPEGITKLQHRLIFLDKPLDESRKLLTHAEDLTKVSGPKVLPVAVQGNTLSDRILAGTRLFAGGLFTTMLVLFFFLVSGDTFLRRLVEVLPRFSDKRQAVDISQQIESDISVYLVTITCINAAVGLLTGIMAKATGLGDPILWGTLAFLLNYIPVLGPMINLSVLLLAGLMADIDGAALFPATLYLIIHILEGTFITPILLAKRFTLNPVLVILSLIFWYWMWGVPGSILAMPMLAITKIICDRIQPLKAFGHFLER